MRHALFYFRALCYSWKTWIPRGQEEKKARSTILRLWQQNFHVCTRGPHIIWKTFFSKNLLKKELLQELYHFIKSKWFFFHMHKLRGHNMRGLAVLHTSILYVTSLEIEKDVDCDVRRCYCATIENNWFLEKQTNRNFFSKGK